MVCTLAILSNTSDTKLNLFSNIDSNSNLVYIQVELLLIMKIPLAPLPLEIDNCVCINYTYIQNY